MFASVGPPAVSLVVANVVNADGDEEREGKPKPGCEGRVQVIVVPNATLKPRGHLVEDPHGTNKHGPSKPTFCDHGSHKKSDHTGQERRPVPDIAVVTIDVGETKLVHGVDAVKVPQGTSKGEHPNAKSHQQRCG